MFAIASPAKTPYFRAGRPGYTVNDYWIDKLKRYSRESGPKVAVVA
jgi:hypothetical protein